MNYISTDLLTTNEGILNKDVIDTSDDTYIAWATDESINLNTYLNYAISKNWGEYFQTGELCLQWKIFRFSEVYQGILSYLEDYLKSDSNFDKLLYKYLIKSGGISGSQICAIVYEQGVLPMDEAAYNSLASGGKAFSWVSRKNSVAGDYTGTACFRAMYRFCGSH